MRRTHVLVRRAEPTGLVRGQGVCVCERAAEIAKLVVLNLLTLIL